MQLLADVNVQVYLQLLSDAGGGGVCSVGSPDAGLPPTRTVQTKHGRAGALHVQTRMPDTG